MKIEGASFDALMRDLEAALQELRAPFERTATLWDRGHPGKWTAGQHADHLAVGMTVTNDEFEDVERRGRDGPLPPRPGRGPLQWLFVTTVLGTGWLPRGGRAPRSIQPGARPDSADVLRRLQREGARCRALGERTGERERDLLWVRNPFMPRWHYTLSEIVRVHAVHVRHHLRQIEEIAGSR